jgi:hypothetical protein
VQVMRSSLYDGFRIASISAAKNQPAEVGPEPMQQTAVTPDQKREFRKCQAKRARLLICFASFSISSAL